LTTILHWPRRKLGRQAVSKERLGENSSIGLSHVSGLCAIMDYVEQCLGFVKQLYRRMCIRTFLGHSKMLLICGFEFPSRRRFSYLKGSSTISRSSLVHELAFESRYCMSCWRIVCYLLYRTIQVESNCSWYLSNGDPLSSERVAWRLGGTESFIHANFKERTNVTENPNAWDLISFGFHVVSDIAIQWLRKLEERDHL
jgi:hypothetical protein